MFVNTRMKELALKVDTMMIVMEQRIQREDRMMVDIQQNDERMKMFEQSMINFTSMIENQQILEAVDLEEINSA